MLAFFHKHKVTTTLFILILIGTMLRLYNLNWGSPYYFHPDERNIASSVAQLSIPSQLNPNFFAYGSLPIYAIYFTGLYVHLFFGTYNPQVTFPEAIIISRFYSAISSILLIPLLYLIGKKLRDTTTGIIAATLGTFSVGFIQFAHFGTFEMWLTFGLLLLFYYCLEYYKKNSTFSIIMIGILFGALCAIKLSSIAILPLLILTMLLKPEHARSISPIKFVRNLLLVGSIASLVYLITNPYVIMDFPTFLGSMRYESGVATGTIPVFYTGEFSNITRVLYPFIFIYPFLLNPLLGVLFIPAFIYILFRTYKAKRAFLLLVTTFLLLFASQAVLFVQWTRYYVSTIPFIILITSICIMQILQIKNRTKLLTIQICFSLLLLYTAIYALAFTMTTYVERDTRIQASTWAQKNIDPNASITSEVYDLGILPFNESHPTISLFDFYALDDGTKRKLPQPTTINTDYIILPSQRIIKTRLLDPKSYPNGNYFYQNLVNGSSGYTKLYETPCTTWCQITYLMNPIYSFEGTASVFDRPTVIIFKKND